MEKFCHMLAWAKVTPREWIWNYKIFKSGCPKWRKIWAAIFIGLGIFVVGLTAVIVLFCQDSTPIVLITIAGPSKHNVRHIWLVVIWFWKDILTGIFPHQKELKWGGWDVRNVQKRRGDHPAIAHTFHSSKPSRTPPPVLTKQNILQLIKASIVLPSCKVEPCFNMYEGVWEDGKSFLLAAYNVLLHVCPSKPPS